MFTPRSKVILHDLIAIALAWSLALLARFNFELPPEPYLSVNLRALPLVLLIQGVITWRFGLYRGLWRFASLPDLWNIIRAAVLGALCVTVTLFVLNRLEGVPRSILILYPVFLIFLMGGPRLMYRLWKDHSLSLKNLTGAQRVLVIGAGSGGEMLIRDMLRDGSYIPVGLVDDSTSLARRRIHGVPVLGTVARLPELAERYDIDLLVIAIPSASNVEMQRIVDVCETAQRPFRTLPRLQDMVAGKVNLEAVREVSIDDLLGRDKVELDWHIIQAELAGRPVLVTGGGGSIGSELCRQVARLGASRVIIYEQSEHNLYLIEKELRGAYPHLPLHCVLGDVCDRSALDNLFTGLQPRIVFHAAAYKHVPILEFQAREAVRNNILGTREIVAAAERHGCDSFVLISTDKAVEPSSIMGATKRVAEFLCERRNGESNTRFVTVRFGNVLGSAGSVVPLFQEQIRAGGPVTVTHPEAIRYFMTIPEASQLILQAAAIGQSGQIFVLDMGQPVNITYLAEQMIRLSGQIPGQEIRIVYTGLRPGEKLKEELFHMQEHLTPTTHDKLMLARHAVLEPGLVDDLIGRLEQACETFDEETLEHVLKEEVPKLSQDHGSAADNETVVDFKRSS
jgi:FlaA1/EpsC-like NDP-sugar epimerase